MIEELQTLVADRLELLHQEAGLAAVPIVTERRGDLDSRISERLVRADAGILVMTPAWQRGQMPDQIQVDVGVVLTFNTAANTATTGTRRTANEIGEMILAALHGWTPSDETWSALEFQAWGPREADTPATVMVYLATFRTSAQIQIES